MSSFNPIDCVMCKARAECAWGENAEELIRVGGRIPKAECALHGGRLIHRTKNKISEESKKC